MSMVTLAQAKRHLQIWTPITSPLDDVDEDITLKLAQAESIIIDYLKSNDGWDETTVPPLVQAAVLLQLAELFRFRGDDPASAATAPTYADGQLSPAITNILRRYRDPAMS